MSVSRIELVEVIKNQAAGLSPEGRDLAGRMELLAEVAPGSYDPTTYSAQRAQAEEAQAEEAQDLSPRDRSIIERLLLLWEGLEKADLAEGQGEPEEYRNLAVIAAAAMKDSDEGNKVDPSRTPEQAVSWLKGAARQQLAEPRSGTGEAQGSTSPPLRGWYVAVLVSIVALASFAIALYLAVTVLS